MAEPFSEEQTESLKTLVGSIVNSAISARDKMADKKRQEDRDAVTAAFAKTLDEKLSALKPPEREGGESVVDLDEQHAPVAIEKSASHRAEQDARHQAREHDQPGQRRRMEPLQHEEHEHQCLHHGCGARHQGRSAETAEAAHGEQAAVCDRRVESAHAPTLPHPPSRRLWTARRVSRPGSRGARRRGRSAAHRRRSHRCV